MVFYNSSYEESNEVANSNNLYIDFEEQFTSTYRLQNPVTSADATAEKL